MPSINFLTFDNCLVSGVFGPQEILSIANLMAAEDGECLERFDGLKVLSLDGKDATGFSGLQIQVDGALLNSRPDVLVIPPCFGGIELLLEDGRLCEAVLELANAGTIVSTVCAGSFLLAAGGFLNGKTATTHWNLQDRFRNLFPEVDLQPQLMLIDGGGYICAGGAMAWQDLSLHLISRFMSPDIASRCAKMLVMDPARKVQAPYFMFENKENVNEGASNIGIEEVQRWMRENYSQPLQVKDLAARSGLGSRTFLRKFRKHTGMNPNNYLQQLRIEAARHMLELENLSVEEITGKIGYENSSSFRRLFKNKTGMSPREYRSRFSRLGD